MSMEDAGYLVSQFVLSGMQYIVGVIEMCCVAARSSYQTETGMICMDRAFRRAYIALYVEMLVWL